MPKPKLLSLLAACLLLLPAVAPHAQSDSSAQLFLLRTLSAARDKYHLPALAALVQVDGRVLAQAAVGVRAEGHNDSVLDGDRWHIGSDTKAMTATLIARLVEQQRMRFEDTLATSFPEFPGIDPAYRGVTVTQLLSHTAGLPSLTDGKDMDAVRAAIRPFSDVRAQRQAIVRHYLSLPPASTVGEFRYSNLGFIIAGAIAEARTGRSWENLIREQVFSPLGIANVGFGAPGNSDRIDQPRGHRVFDGRLVPLDPLSPDADNPAALGPAGTVNIGLKDWARFAQDQLDGERGRGRLLTTASYRRLHTAVTAHYALGWGVHAGPDGSPLLLTHTGTNTYWLASISLFPRHDTIFLIVSNAGPERADAAIDEVRRALKERLRLLD
jgi:D-alanyl-D-alanine carboxypeptidase